MANLSLSLILQGNRGLELLNEVGDDNGVKCNRSRVLANAELMLVLGGTTRRDTLWREMEMWSGT